MSLPNRMDPFAALANYPEGTIVWFDPSGEQQIVNSNLKSISSFYRMFWNSGAIRWDLDLPKATSIYQFIAGSKKLEYARLSIPMCENLDHAFNGCSKLKTVILQDAENVTSAQYAFNSNTSLEEFNNDLPGLKNSSSMFYQATNLKKYSGNLDSLENSGGMFYHFKSRVNFEFHSALPSLVTGDNMFGMMCLDAESVIRVLRSLPKHTDGQTHKIGMGDRLNWRNNAEVAKLLGTTVPIPNGQHRCYEIKEDGSLGDDKGWVIS